MDDKNKKLALKNLQLKVEIDRLTEHQTSLMKENIKATYYGNRTYRRMVEILDDNLRCIRKAYESTLRLKKQVDGGETGGLGDLSDSCEEMAEDMDANKGTPPLSDRSNAPRLRKKHTKIFNRSKSKAMKK